jgi:hypothetical protein
VIALFAFLLADAGTIGLLALLVILALFVLDRLALWMEGRGWIYWRKVKPKGGGMSRTLTAMQEFVQPEIQHVMEDREQRAALSDDLSGSVGDKKVTVVFPTNSSAPQSTGASKGAGQSPGPACTEGEEATRSPH